MFCDADGLSEPVGNCAPGWYCSGGSFSSKPQTYVNGSFTINVSCPTYLMNETGGMCLAGKRCSATGNGIAPHKALFPLKNTDIFSYFSFKTYGHSFLMLSLLNPHFYMVKLGFTGLYIIF